VSSHQFDQPERGFSTRFEGDLDMRMDKRQALTAFKVPEEFVVCKEFPRTSVGKVQRHLLRQAHLERSRRTAGRNV